MFHGQLWVFSGPGIFFFREKNGRKKKDVRTTHKSMDCYKQWWNEGRVYCLDLLNKSLMSKE